MNTSLHLSRVNGAPSAEEAGYDLLLTAAAGLLTNGESTTGSLAAAEVLGERLGIEAVLAPTWGELFLQAGGERARVRAATPSGVNMSRVIATLRAVEQVRAGQLAGASAQAALVAADRAPQSGLGRFVLACSLGAGALAIINGATHAGALVLIMAGAGAGALLRRGLAQWLGANVFLQDLAAALLAGVVGGLAVRWQLSTPLRLVALGPLLVLVPGPTLLNGALDLAALRLPLGLARVSYGLLTILVISAGVLLGLGLCGISLPATVTGQAVPLWLDVGCAGVAAAAYGVFYAMPPRLLIYPVLVGMLAHATRWGVVSGLGLNNAVGAGLACLVAGLIMVPLAWRHRLPFAGVGFAAVVSMVPGIFLFRMGGGLIDLQKQAGATSLALVGGVFSDGVMALLTIVTMTLGLVLPLSAYARFRPKRNSRSGQLAEVSTQPGPAG